MAIPPDSPNEALKAKILSELPKIPHELVDEAEKLLNVRLNGSESLIERLKLAYAFLDKFNRQFVGTFTSAIPDQRRCQTIRLRLHRSVTIENGFIRNWAICPQRPLNLKMSLS
jgi:hypothetical protein